VESFENILTLSGSKTSTIIKVLNYVHSYALFVESMRLHLCFPRYLVHVVALMHAKFGSDSCLPLSDASLDAPPNSVLQTSKMAREAADVEAEKVRAAKELELQDLAALHAKVTSLFLCYVLRRL